MKKTIKILALIFILISLSISISCKSDTQKQIEEYDLRKAKLQYTKDLLDVKQDLSYKERMRLIDSLLEEERKNTNDNSN